MKVHEVFAYLHVNGAARAIDYYTRALGANERFRLEEPSGRVGHAELEIGGTVVMLADEFPECGVRSPQTIGGPSVTIHLHVDDADALIRRMVDEGGELAMEPKDQFYGERSGVVIDSFGHRWTIGHSIEEVSPEEMQRRYDALCGGES